MFVHRAWADYWVPMGQLPVQRGQLSGLLGQFDLGTATKVAQSAAGSASEFQAILNWLTGKVGELKIQATQFVESLVRMMHANLRDGCAVTPSAPLPGRNSQTPAFCEGSVQGMIERCRLGEAGALLEKIKTELLSRASGSSPDAPYVRRWVDQYWGNDYSNLSVAIVAARATCGLVGTVPKACQAGYEWDFGRFQCVPKGTTGGGIIGNGDGGDGINLQSMLPIAIVAGMAGIALLAFSGGGRKR